ncbi:SDR family NAD(P)-dependent oxidoreductase [Pollutibacter soli]|uniref:SDR family NAD(P)-dependent oxidoreductase n=1 Tax=Pollutibacter soli TaxID=3034157 RepID=UPI003013869A
MGQTNLAGKAIVIIGGTSGIGLSAAKACKEAGAQIVVTGLDSGQKEELMKILGTDSPVLYNDATSESAAVDAIELCINRFGSFDGLYHVAGGSGRKYGDGPLDQITLEGWNKTLELNLTSIMLSNRAAVKQFMKSGNAGAILNLGSVLGYSPSATFFHTHAYAAAKSAIIGFSKSIAAYYAGRNIRANVIAPALVDTPMSQRAMNDVAISSFVKSKQPLDGGRSGIPEDLDGLAIFLLSDQSKFITGQVIAVDGGWSLTDGQIPNPL